MSMATVDWTAQLLDRLDRHWGGQLRARLEGLTDDEYFWEPAQPAWNVRPRGTSSAPVHAGSGEFVVEFAFPEPDPPPVTTIAWRLAHVIVGVLGMRVAAHFVLHINREVIHHGAEVGLLRDLYRARTA